MLLMRSKKIVEWTNWALIGRQWSTLWAQTWSIWRWRQCSRSCWETWSRSWKICWKTTRTGSWWRPWNCCSTSLQSNWPPSGSGQLTFKNSFKIRSTPTPSPLLLLNRVIKSLNSFNNSLSLIILLILFNQEVEIMLLVYN